MTPARFVFRDSSVTTTFRPTSASSDGTAKAFGESPACSPTMPGAGARSCRDILKGAVSAGSLTSSRSSSADASSATATSLASSLSASATTTTTATTTTQRHLQKQEKQGAPACIRRSSSSSSRVSFGTIEIHVVEPVPASADTTNGEASQTSTKSTISDDAEEEETSSSSAVEEKAPSPPLSLHTGSASRKEEASLGVFSQHGKPTPRASQENEDTGADTNIHVPVAEDTTTDHEEQPNDSTAPPKQEPIKCGLETYERLRPPRRSRTELFLDAVRERSRRKLSHRPLSEEVIEAQKDLADKHHSRAAAAAAATSATDGGGHVDNNDCTLRRSDAVMSRSSNLNLEATKNRRSKRLDQLQGAAEGEIERSETGGVRSWSSNYGGGVRL